MAGQKPYAVRPSGTTIKSFLLPDQEQAFALIFANGVVRVPGGSFARALRAFSLDPTDWPWLSEDAPSSSFYVLFYILTYKSIFLSPEFLKREQTRQFACKFNLKPNYGTKVWPIGSESAKLNVCFVFDITWIPECISGQESKVLTVNNQTETHFRQIYLATSTSSSAKWDALTNVLLSQISPLFWSYCPTFFNVLCKILLQSKCLARAIFWLPK